MVNVSTGADAYQDLDEIRQRVDYQGTDFFQDNAELKFDELLVELEREARGIFETLWGDQTPLEELDRVDVIRTTDDASIPLVYPIQDVQTVEFKNTLDPTDPWETLEENKWDFTDHRLVLIRSPSLRANRGSYIRRANPLTDTTTRMTWVELAAKLRVTYDRGFAGGAPADVINIQTQMINRALRYRKREQTVAAASPEELASESEPTEMLTDDLRDRIADVTKPSRAVMSV